MDEVPGTCAGVAVVTGGTSGVGRATVRELAKRGFDVGVLARGTDALDATASEVRAAGRRVLAISVDVADASAVENAADAVEAELGPIDVWVNDAMTSVFAPFTEISPDEFERVTSVDYLGFVNGTRSALARMRPRDRGVIVQVGSALAYRGIPLQSAYCGAKHAIQGFTESVRTELMHEHSRIHLAMVQMPALNTPQFQIVRSKLPHEAQPVPPIYQPEVAARAIADVISHPRREVWVGESTFATIVANRIVPGLLDRYLGRTGYASQQTSTPEPEGRPDDLFSPVPGDRGAHGTFDDRALAGTPYTWANRHRLLSALAAAAVVGTVAGARKVRSTTTRQVA